MICGGWLRGMLILHADISLPIWLSFTTGMSSATISSLSAIRVPIGFQMFQHLQIIDGQCARVHEEACKLMI